MIGIDAGHNTNQETIKEKQQKEKRKKQEWSSQPSIRIWETSCKPPYGFLYLKIDQKPKRQKSVPDENVCFTSKTHLKCKPLKPHQDQFRLFTQANRLLIMEETHIPLIV